ncbi:dual specificity phosphatase 19 (predicted), isoform CRA_a [Rattus norvegicus]|uniref:Dual specificity phosphatase 19 (Predicted), isoform CRA_a n=1 Tax=Rattus norvegicus TaxID=10116 RepID=A6HMN4_RAT|nr:dual specificity phosphatase 19 (predicted), isoform CRA_a [Rattus norvegicus]
MLLPPPPAIPVPPPRVVHPISLLPFASERVLHPSTPPGFELFNLGAKCSVYGSPAILFLVFLDP